MVIQIKNETQLKKLMGLIVEEVIEVVSIEVREKLKIQILKDTYMNDYWPNRVYESGTGQPSWEFLEAWRWKSTRKSLNNLSRELYYGWENLTIDKKSGRHWDNGKDIRKKLADLLNIDGIFGHKMRANYWDNFIESMFDDGELENLFVKEFKKRGVEKV